MQWTQFIAKEISHERTGQAGPTGRCGFLPHPHISLDIGTPRDNQIEIMRSEVRQDYGAQIFGCAFLKYIH
jgi:hypothetical protein